MTCYILAMGNDISPIKSYANVQFVSIDPHSQGSVSVVRIESD